MWGLRFSMCCSFPDRPRAEGARGSPTALLTFIYETSGISSELLHPVCNEETLIPKYPMGLIWAMMTRGAWSCFLRLSNVVRIL